MHAGGAHHEASPFPLLALPPDLRVRVAAAVSQLDPLRCSLNDMRLCCRALRHDACVSTTRLTSWNHKSPPGRSDVPLLAAVLRQLPALEDLDFRSCVLHKHASADAAEQWTPPAAVSFLSPALNQLSSLRRLRTLTLSGCGLCTPDVPALARAITQLSRLEELNLSGNWIGSAGAAALEPALKRFPGLLDLDLSVCDLGDWMAAAYGRSGAPASAPAALPAPRTLAPLFSTVTELTRLRRLDIGVNHIRDAAAAGLGPLLAACSGSLQELEISRNELMSGALTALATVLRQMTGLRSLCLKMSDLSGEGAVMLALVLRDLALQHLFLSGTKLGPEGHACLEPVLMQMTGLLTLEITHNNVGGAALLLPLLQRLSGLQNLSIGGDDVGPEGVALLAPALVRMTRMTCLGFTHNAVGPEGASMLTAVLPALTGLRSLDLEGNDLRAAGAATLAFALRALAALTKLNLAVNDLGAEGVWTLVPGLLALKRLRCLNLSNNFLEEQDGVVPALSAMLLHELPTLTDVFLTDD